MGCVSILCVYIGIGVGYKDQSWANAAYAWTQNGKEVHATIQEYPLNNPMGRIRAGIQTKWGEYLEIEHISSIPQPRDDGLNAIWIGQRWQWGM